MGPDAIVRRANFLTFPPGAKAREFFLAARRSSRFTAASDAGMRMAMPPNAREGRHRLKICTTSLSTHADRSNMADWPAFLPPETFCLTTL